MFLVFGRKASQRGAVLNDSAWSNNGDFFVNSVGMMGHYGIAVFSNFATTDLIETDEISEYDPESGKPVLKWHAPLNESRPAAIGHDTLYFPIKLTTFGMGNLIFLDTLLAIKSNGSISLLTTDAIDIKTENSPVPIHDQGSDICKKAKDGMVSAYAVCASLVDIKTKKIRYILYQDAMT